MNCQEIERCITKEFSKSLIYPTKKAIKTYNMIEKNDKICVCISGGKDSILLAKVMQNLQKYGDIPFSLEFLAMDGGYSPHIREHIEQNANLLQIPVKFFSTDVLKVVKNHAEQNPCFLCSKMRRGYLYSEAQKLGCNKIALGHHYDDAIQTVLMGLIYGGQIQAMLPRLKSKNYPDMELIRPLYFVREKDVTAWANYCSLTFLPCGCPASERKEDTKRAQIAALIQTLASENPQIEANILNAVKQVDVKKVLGFKDLNGDIHSSIPV